MIDSMNPATLLRTAREIVRSRCDAMVLPWWVLFWPPPFFTIVSYVKKYSRAKTIFICHNVVAHESVFFEHDAGADRVHGRTLSAHITNHGLVFWLMRL